MYISARCKTHNHSPTFTTYHRYYATYHRSRLSTTKTMNIYSCGTNTDIYNITYYVPMYHDIIILRSVNVLLLFLLTHYCPRMSRTLTFLHINKIFYISVLFLNYTGSYGDRFATPVGLSV